MPRRAHTRNTKPAARTGREADGGVIVPVAGSAFLTHTFPASLALRRRTLACPCRGSTAFGSDGEGAALLKPDGPRQKAMREPYGQSDPTPWLGTLLPLMPLDDAEQISGHGEDGQGYAAYQRRPVGPLLQRRRGSGISRNRVRVPVMPHIQHGRALTPLAESWLIRRQTTE